MSLRVQHTRRPYCFQASEHVFKLLAYSRDYRVNLEATLARGVDLDGLADFDGGMERSVNVGLVGEILLVSLHRLQHLIGRCLFAKVLRGIEGDLLGEVGIR